MQAEALKSRRVHMHLPWGRSGLYAIKSVLAFGEVPNQGSVEHQSEDKNGIGWYYNHCCSLRLSFTHDRPPGPASPIHPHQLSEWDCSPGTSFSIHTMTKSLQPCPLTCCAALALVLQPQTLPTPWAVPSLAAAECFPPHAVGPVP